MDPTNRWYIPAHNFQRIFSSASGAVNLQVVSIDSTPLHDRYLYSGASGGGYATGINGADRVPNAVTSNIVINPGVTAANGFTNGNYFNQSVFQCYYSFASSTTASGFAAYTGSVAFPGSAYGLTATNAGWMGAVSGNWNKASSGCKYASMEIAPLATPAARAATWANTAAWFQAGSTTSQHQVLFSHFPLLSTQQRLTPYFDNALSTLGALGSAGPQAYYNGHDHIMAAVQNASLFSVNGQATVFVTTGAAGVSDYPLGGSTTSFPAGYATGAAAVTQANGSTPYAAQPSSSAAAPAAYNPDVLATSFWSNFNGFTMTTVNATSMKIDYYLVNCTLQAWGVPCSPVPIGPVYTLYRPAKTPAVPTGTAQAFFVALAGVTASNFASLTSKTAFVAAVAQTIGVPANTITFNGTSAGPSGSLVVAFTVYSATPATVATAVAAAVAAPTLLANINAGLVSCNIAATATSSFLAPSPPPPSPPAPAASLATTATVSLAGYTVATFTPAAATVFSATVAANVGVAPSSVIITSVSAVTVRRSLPGSGVSVAFTVLSSAAAATNVAASMANLGSPAFLGNLTSACTAAGVPAPTGVVVTSQPVLAGPVTAAPAGIAALPVPQVGPLPSDQGDKGKAVGLGIGLGLGLGLVVPLAAYSVFLMIKKRAPVKA